MILTTGLPKSLTTRFFQVGGLIASLASVSKFCAEWHIFTAFNLDFGDIVQIPTDFIPTDFCSTLKAMLFFAPHVIFRTASTAFVVAYLKLYAIIPLAVFVITSICINCFVYGKEDRIDGIIWLPLSILTPTVYTPFLKVERRLLKATMLASTLTLLPCLILIRLLPLLPYQTLVCTFGLSHLNLNLADINIPQINLNDINLNPGSTISRPNLTCEIPSCNQDMDIPECSGGCHTEMLLKYHCLRHPLPDGYHHGALLRLLLCPPTHPWNVVSH